MIKKDVVIGYTAGVYDLFHIGHLNLLKNANGMCDKLIVGVTVDELVKYKSCLREIKNPLDEILKGDYELCVVAGSIYMLGQIFKGVL